MPSWIEELVIVLASSRKTQVILLFAFVMPILIIGVGAFASHTITFAEPFAALAGPVRTAVFHRYVFAAIFAFLSALPVAARQFARARRRILS